MHELLASRKQGIAISESPAVILNVGEFDSRGTRGFGENEHFRELIDVTPVNNKVESDGEPMTLEPSENANLVCVGLGAGDFVGGLLAGALKA